MKEDDNTFSFSEFNDSNSYILGNLTDNKIIFNTNIDTIINNDNDNHYICNNCHKFPFIKFCKNRKSVRITCSCFNNKKISIEELFKLSSIKDSISIFLSETNLNKNIENELICKKHNKKFKGFSKFLLNNYCEDCYNYINELDYNKFIRFDDIKIGESKIEQLIDKINNYNDISNEQLEEISNNFKIIQNSDCNYISLLEEKEKRFQKLINIIVNDYKNYPNFSHFFNIKNLLHFFNIEDMSIEKEVNFIDDNLMKKNAPIIIEYINNISCRTKLFSKIFVKNNRNKCIIEIEGERLNLIEDYEFKAKDRMVRVKLFLKKNVSEINLYKMFSNCTNLISVNGISKLKKINNINKIFYNCISLSSIPDFKEWKIPKDNAYLMFYNCISLVFFTDKRELNLDKYIFI